MEKSYKMDLTTRHKVTFVKKGVRHAKGAQAEVTLPVALKWFKQGKIGLTDDLKKAFAACGLDEFLGKKEAGK